MTKIIKSFGLSKANKEAYLKLRRKYNQSPPSSRDYRDLYLLVMYGFQQQIRFNTSYEYNNPVGQAGFNDYMLEKLLSFIGKAKSKNITFFSEDYTHFEQYIKEDDFVYCDPPYLATLGSYNDGKRGFNGWGESEEQRLLDFLLRLNNAGISFMLSNVIEHNGKHNSILMRWIDTNGFRVIEHNGKARKGRKEILVVNYKTK